MPVTIIKRGSFGKVKVRGFPLHQKPARNCVTLSESRFDTTKNDMILNVDASLNDHFLGLRPTYYLYRK